ncbi:unnamed protein product [marine sediment metagenome]|uniref:Uncharacterized protein n=1 Tax=marine sediment metagenome TaxID=412755 RepID=X1EK88_9ZZZZ
MIFSFYASLLGGSYGIQAPEENHSNSIKLYRDFAHWFTGIAHQEQPSQACFLKLGYYLLHHRAAEGGYLAKVSQYFSVATGYYLPNRGHFGSDEHL